MTRTTERLRASYIVPKQSGIGSEQDFQRVHENMSATVAQIP